MKTEFLSLKTTVHCNSSVLKTVNLTERGRITLIAIPLNYRGCTALKPTARWHLGNAKEKN